MEQVRAMFDHDGLPAFLPAVGREGRHIALGLDAQEDIPQVSARVYARGLGGRASQPS